MDREVPGSPDDDDDPEVPEVAEVVAGGCAEVV